MISLFQGFCRQFGLGYAIQTVIKFLSLLPKIPFRPSILLHVLFNKESVSLGAFLGCYSAIFKVSEQMLAMCVHACMYVHACISVFVWARMCACMCICVCMHTCAYVCLGICVHVCERACLCVNYTYLKEKLFSNKCIFSHIKIEF